MQAEAIYGHWNQSDGLIHHRKLLFDQRQAIKVALEHFNVSDIQEAISNYSEILTDDKYFWTYRWTLTEFLTRRDGRKGTDPYKWWQFLKNNFRKEKYLTIQATSDQKTKLYPIHGKTCGIRSCRLPAVYKGQGAEYDNFRCTNHMPESVKELYCKKGSEYYRR